MRKRIKWMTVAAVLLLGITTACDKDDDNVPPAPDVPSGENVFEATHPGEADLGTDLLDSMIYQCLLTDLMKADTLGNGAVIYSPRYGYVLYPEHPDVYYIGVETAPDAADYFREMMVPTMAKDSIRTLPDGSMRLSTLRGSLTYRAGGENDAVATVDVDLEDVPSVVRYVFLLESEWPLNEDISSPFLYGQIWKRNNGWYYICVKEWDAWSPGILLTFDGGWTQDWYTTYMKCYSGPFCVDINCASMAAFKGLSHLVHKQSTLYDESIEELNNQVPGGGNSATLHKLISYTNRHNCWECFNVGTAKWCRHGYTIFEPYHYHVWIDRTDLRRDNFQWTDYFGCAKIDWLHYCVYRPYNETPSSEYIFTNECVEKDGQISIGNYDTFTMVVQ